MPPKKTGRDLVPEIIYLLMVRRARLRPLEISERKSLKESKWSSAPLSVIRLRASRGIVEGQEGKPT